MKRTKKYLTIILTACLVLTNVMPTIAETNQDPVEEQAIPIQENTVDEAKEIEMATPSDADMLDTETMSEEVEEIPTEPSILDLFTVKNAQTGESLYYKIDSDDKILHISSVNGGEGYLHFDSSNTPPWQGLEIKSDINSVIIETPIRPSSVCSWFSGFTSLTSVTGSYIDTSKVTNMSGMFSDCTSLQTLDVGEFNTSNVMNMSEMFSGCTSLTTLDVGALNTSNVMNMSEMFKGCSGLETIYAQSFNTAKVGVSDNMFTGCIKLCGGNGTGFAASKTDKNYACIDKYGQSGYLTYGGSDRAKVLFVSKGQTVYTRTVKSGDGITVPDYVRTGCDGWYISNEIKYSPGDKFATTVGESAYTLYDEWAGGKTNWQITFDDQEGYAEYSESSGTVSFTPAAVADGPASITYGIDNCADYFSITDPYKAEITIKESTPAAEYAIQISAIAAEDALHKQTSKTINYKLTIYHKSQIDAAIHSNNTEYGTVSAEVVSNVPYGTAITASENVLSIGLTDITAAPAENTNKYSYSFKEWKGIPASGTVTADIAITAVFERTARKHTASGSSSKPVFTGTWGNPVTGIWTQYANGEWHFRTTAPFISTWGYIVNPYAQAGQNQADWFWFDDKGCMLTGWRYINGYWYYLNPVKGGNLGACFIGPGRTPDGYEIDAAGAWTGRKGG